MLDMNKKYKILIVDDSRFNRLVMTSMLAKDYLLEEACDGKEATLILQDRAEEFSLVLLDIVMPNMNGFEFLQVMKECGWLDFLPVIIISSEYSPENVETSYRLGASDLIQRPYDEQVVCHRIANTIALSSKHRELSNALVDEVIKENENSAAMVSILSHIVETRNGESGAHVQNIRHITGLLLDELMKKTDQYPMSKEDMLQIITASSLHDIGKMSVPEEILNKPGRLTDEEFQVIKKHAMAGAEMVEPLLQQENANPLIRMTYEICRWHHERYDGRGYPDGLKGDEIPIAAQVVSVADVYDALTSERCYKPAHTPDQAMQMIREGQCGAFHPLLLECLSDILDKLKSPSYASEDVIGDGTVSNQLLVADLLSHSRENGLFSSDKIMQTLTRERMRAKFFFNGPCAAFYYTTVPPVLHLNKAGRELFGVDESIIGPDQALDSCDGYDPNVVERLRDSLAAATTAHPVVHSELTLTPRGEAPQRYQCVMQTIWDSTDTQQYTEVTGRLIPLDSELSRIPVPNAPDWFAAPSSEMTGKDAWYLINALRFMVYNVRLVDPSDQSIVELDSNGRMTKSGQHCYSLWKRSHMCDDCISADCLNLQKESSKIVFFEEEVLYVVSQYIKVDGTPLVLELLTRITDDMMIDTSGRKLSGASIGDLSKKLYLDPLTNAYNRRYFNAKVKDLHNVAALAIINVDQFNRVNDKYGRAVGDNALVCIAETIGGKIHAPDTLSRYGGDEFVVLFQSISQEAFVAMLETIRSDVSALSIDGMEDGQQLTVSIGGAFGPDIPAVLMKKADEMLHKAKQEQNIVELWKGRQSQR